MRNPANPIIWSFWGAVIVSGVLTLGSMAGAPLPDNALLCDPVSAAKQGGLWGTLLAYLWNWAGRTPR